MKIDVAPTVPQLADVLHQARFPRRAHGRVPCAGPKLCCGQDHEMARALLRRFRILPRKS